MLPRQHPGKTPPIGIRQCLELNGLVVQTACQWADKHLGANVRILGDRNIRKGTQKLGTWFYEILRCCERLDTLREKQGREPIGAVRRFEGIVEEFYVQTWQRCILSLYKIEATEFTSYVGKDLCIAELNAVCSRVKNDAQGDDRKPPEPKAFEVCPKFTAFIEDGMDIADSNSIFKQQFWKRMLAAWREAIKELDGHCVVHHVSPEAVKVQKGKGRDLRNLTPLYLEALSRNAFLEALPEGQLRS